MRATMSVPPPAEAPTMMRTGFEGHGAGCAHPASEVETASMHTAIHGDFIKRSPSGMGDAIVHARWHHGVFRIRDTAHAHASRLLVDPALRGECIRAASRAAGATGG